MCASISEGSSEEKNKTAQEKKIDGHSDHASDVLAAEKAREKAKQTSKTLNELDSSLGSFWQLVSKSFQIFTVAIMSFKTSMHLSICLFR